MSGCFDGVDHGFGSSMTCPGGNRPRAAWDAVKTSLSAGSGAFADTLAARDSAVEGLGAEGMLCRRDALKSNPNNTMTVACHLNLAVAPMRFSRYNHAGLLA